ncbi:phosphoribosyltransferase [Agarivorans albus]|uniref:Hypoxanthine-guanine phosphoribosyltransferase n=1 Tax=Agarivorans albus MKT 106 TaxID=1331007 RepID=R9PSR7_AGAAL|nr:phosphoribosyltransferase family protein [Agarivorans albus]GAD01231.1 hypoxanthine-guanine phosphoribosyltransferase [Agarivorans albus MKT 106]
MSDKLYITGQELLEDSFRLGEKVLASGFKPSFIIAVWRGGAPIGIAVQEFLAYHCIASDNIAIRTSSYAAAIDNQAKQVKVFGLNYLVKHVQQHDRLLIVDDVFDTGRSVEAIINELSRLARLNTPSDIRVAVPYFKPERNKTDRVPDYYLHETKQWLKYPHSLEGLSPKEIAERRPELYQIIKAHLPK